MGFLKSYIVYNELVVSTPLKNISQNGNLPQTGVKIKQTWNHHLDKVGLLPLKPYKMDGIYWKTLFKWMIWVYHYFRKHPYIVTYISNFKLNNSHFRKIHASNFPKSNKQHSPLRFKVDTLRIGSMYGMFTYIYHENN